MNLTAVKKTLPARGRTFRGGLVRLAVAMVLIVHQAGAGIVCLCNEEGRQSRPGIQVDRPASPPAHACHAEPGEEAAVAEDGAPRPSVQAQTGIQIRITPPCCTLLTQPDHQATAAGESIALQAPHSPSPASEANAFRPTPPLRGNPCPQRSRPLYQTQSCYLI